MLRSLYGRIRVGNQRRMIRFASSVSGSGAGWKSE